MILETLYLMLPAYFANMAPVLFRKAPILGGPLDFNCSFREKRVFGKNKTIRGLVFGVLAGIIIAFIQHSLSRYAFFRDISILNYDGWLVVGFLMGFGAIIGDAVESFFKRQSGIMPGDPWIPFDQIDFSFGALLLLLLYQNPGWVIMLIAVILTFFLHILTNHAAYYLKIRNEKW